MKAPIANVETGQVVFPKGGKKDTVREEATSVRIPESLMKQLADLATGDGFESDAKTDAGVLQQTNKACRAYVLVAIERLLADREELATEGA